MMAIREVNEFRQKNDYMFTGWCNVIIRKKIKSVFSFFDISIARKKSFKKKQKSKKEERVWMKIQILKQVPTIIDAGVGPDGTPHLYKHFDNSHFIFIDPLIECKKAVQKFLENGDIFINAAVGDRSDKMTLNVARKASRTTFYNRTKYLSQAVEKRLVDVYKLDDIMANISFEHPYGLKIDTEGHELSVLYGARETLRKCHFVIVEFHYYDSCQAGYTLADIIDFMSSNCFKALFILGDGRSIVFVHESYTHLYTQK